MLFQVERKPVGDILVQGGVAITAGIIIFAALFLPWLSTEYTAISGMTHAETQAAVVIPMTLILIATLTVFGGIIHILGYVVGIQLATVMSAAAFFISVMIIIITLVGANSSGEPILDRLIGPWISTAGSIFGAISSKLERK